MCIRKQQSGASGRKNLTRFIAAIERDSPVANSRRIAAATTQANSHAPGHDRMTGKVSGEHRMIDIHDAALGIR